jgi:t-SNARE complex subunit (syntaxin)
MSFYIVTRLQEVRCELQLFSSLKSTRTADFTFHKLCCIIIIIIIIIIIYLVTYLTKQSPPR